ncbi:galectin-1 [Gastrophryne carolinensis]
MAAEGVVLKNLKLKQGHCVEVKGFVPDGCKGFAINLGKDSDNFCLHLNARFDIHGDSNTIVCNSKQANTWGKEQRETIFPFQQGAETTVNFRLEGDQIIVQLSSGEQFSFPLREKLDEISFLSLDELQLKCLTVE